MKSFTSLSDEILAEGQVIPYSEQPDSYWGQTHPYFGIDTPFAAGNQVGFCAPLAVESDGDADDVFYLAVLFSVGVAVALKCEVVTVFEDDAVQYINLRLHFSQNDIAHFHIGAGT